MLRLLSISGYLAVVSADASFRGSQEDVRKIDPATAQAITGSVDKLVESTVKRLDLKMTQTQIIDEERALEAEAIRRANRALGRYSLITGDDVAKRMIATAADAHKNKKTSASSYAKHSGVLTDCGNTSHTLQVSAGSPSIPFNVIPDSGSSNLWFPGTAVSKQVDGSAHHFFDYEKSTTYQPVIDKSTGKNQTFDIEYGSGPVSGFFASDIISSFAGYEPARMTFALAEDVSGIAQIYDNFDGILGMAWSGAISGGVETFWHQLVKQGVLDAAVFAFRLGRTDGAEGSLIVGVDDKDLYWGDLNRIDLTFKKTPEHLVYWQVPMDSVSMSYGDDVDGEPEAVNVATQAIIDSGTSWVTVPIAAAQEILTKLHAEVDQDSGDILVPSDAKFAFNFIINGESYPLTEVDMTGSSGVDGFKRLFIIPKDFSGYGFEHNGWILGDIFMSKYYCLFDGANKQMGFAYSKDYFPNGPHGAIKPPAETEVSRRGRGGDDTTSVKKSAALHNTELVLKIVAGVAFGILVIVGSIILISFCECCRYRPRLMEDLDSDSETEAEPESTIPSGMMDMEQGEYDVVKLSPKNHKKIFTASKGRSFSFLSPKATKKTPLVNSSKNLFVAPRAPVRKPSNNRATRHLERHDSSSDGSDMSD